MTEIANPISESIQRLQETFQSLPDDAFRAPEGAVDFAGRLRECGYPERHIKRCAEGLHGPALAKCDELWPRVRSGDCLLLLVGIRGPGKTQMATEWARRRVCELGKSPGRYVKCADLIGEIKATWHDGGKAVGSEQDVLRKYRRTRYLVIDEFHERGASDWESRALVNIIDHRYDAMLATVIIANLSEQEAAQQINPSILSRANETGGLIVCDWGSYRDQQK